MWQRIKRIFRSIVGWFIELGEDPEMILKQNIRDLEDQVPALNENLAMIKAQVTLIDKDLHQAQRSSDQRAHRQDQGGAEEQQARHSPQLRDDPRGGPDREKGSARAPGQKVANGCLREGPRRSSAPSCSRRSARSRKPRRALSEQAAVRSGTTKVVDAMDLLQGRRHRRDPRRDDREDRARRGQGRGQAWKWPWTVGRASIKYDIEAGRARSCKRTRRLRHVRDGDGAGRGCLGAAGRRRQRENDWRASARRA